MSLREAAPAKVNLCLFLGGVRGDGRHELLTVFESISLDDELELTPLEAGQDDDVVCPGVQGPNLAASALDELRRRGWPGPPVRIEITKRIPVAAGLGGGSADAAAVLRLAARLAPVSEAVLAEVARGLGADVPAQLNPGPSLGTGAGEEVAPVSALGEHAFLVVPSEHALATAEVYREADRLGLGRPAAELARLGGAVRAALNAHARLPAALVVNDLQPAALSLQPEIEEALEAVRGAEADQALVCGSGPTVTGVFWGADARTRAERALRGLGQRFAAAAVAVPVSSPQSGTIEAA